MEKVLQFDGVSYGYKDGHQFNMILDNASYTFEKGKLYAIVGPSGSGKTTTLVLAGGLDKPQNGSVLFKDKDIQNIGETKFRQNNVSIIFQSYNLIYYMNALDNVLNALKIAGMKKENMKDYCLSVLKSLGLSEDECLRDIQKLSGGQQQRVAIARGIAKDVDLILCDEPTGNLDYDNALDIMNILVSLAHDEDKCVIVVTHSKELADLCDVQLSIQHGQLIGLI